MHEGLDRYLPDDPRRESSNAFSSRSYACWGTFSSRSWYAGTGDKLGVLLFAVEEEWYDEYLRLVRQIGLRPMGVCVSSLTEFKEKDLHLLNLKRTTNALRFLLMPSP